MFIEKKDNYQTEASTAKILILKEIEAHQTHSNTIEEGQGAKIIQFVPETANKKQSAVTQLVILP